MGGWLTRVWWGGDPDVVNPVSGLTRREVHLVQKSWAPLAANSLESGTLAFKRLFNTYPETKQLFSMVRDLPEEEYTSCPQFKAHIYNFMNSFNTAVGKLDQPDIVAALMCKLGKSHRKHRVQENHFQDLKIVLVTLFTEVLHMDSKTLTAWDKTVDFCDTAMVGWLTRVWWGGDPDAVNPVSGLTRREVRLVQKSWAPLAAKPLESGTLAFTRLFNTYPETKQLFKMVRNLTEEEYKNCPQFKAHILNFMNSFTMAVNKLNKPNIVAALLYKLGESHKNHNVKENHFHGLKNVLMTLFTDVLRMDSKTLSAWDKTVNFYWRHALPSVNGTAAAATTS